MTEIIEYRLAEVGALLPLIHLPPGKITAIVAGPERSACLMTQELLRLPDVERVMATCPAKDRRVVPFSQAPPRSASLVLLSPEQDPSYWKDFLAIGGVMQAMTFSSEKFGTLHTRMRQLFGNAAVWREHTPAPLYGVISQNGRGSPRKQRDLPARTKRLNDKYLHALFLFGKDELPFAFTRVGSPAPAAQG